MLWLNKPVYALVCACVCKDTPLYRWVCVACSDTLRGKRFYILKKNYKKNTFYVHWCKNRPASLLHHSDHLQVGPARKQVGVRGGRTRCPMAPTFSQDFIRITIKMTCFKASRLIQLHSEGECKCLAWRWYVDHLDGHALKKKHTCAVCMDTWSRKV